MSSITDQLDWLTLQGILVDSGKVKDGEISVPCPLCCEARGSTHQDRPCLRIHFNKVFKDTGKVGVTYYCHHCEKFGGCSDFNGNGTKPQKLATPQDTTKEFKMLDEPRVFTISGLADNQIQKWLFSRGISEETIKHFQISTKYTPAGKSIAQFPYIVDKKVLNIKCRSDSGDGTYKNFTLEKGAELYLYNQDAIQTSLVIFVEGEIDCLSVYESGLISVVSLPNGASKNLQYLDKISGTLSEVNEIILAVDNDAKGKEVRGVLINYLSELCGKDKLRILNWDLKPAEEGGIKDANEFLLKHGKEKLRNFIIEAGQDLPVEGLVGWDVLEESFYNIVKNGRPKGLSTGFKDVDEFYTVLSGQCTWIHGQGNMGKSELLDQWLINLAEQNDWKFILYSAENQPEDHLSKLIEKKIGMNITDGASHPDHKHKVPQAIKWFRSHFNFLDFHDSPPTVYKILEISKKIMELKKGDINGIIIDPWNEVSHVYDGLTETEYISIALGRIRKFARMHNLHIWVVVHPTKPPSEYRGRVGEWIPQRSDIAGSHHWSDKGDSIICCARPMTEDGVLANRVNIYVQKMRSKHIGKLGKCSLDYDRSTGRFYSNNLTRG